MADDPLIFHTSVDCPLPWRTIVPVAIVALIAGVLIGRWWRK